MRVTLADLLQHVDGQTDIRVYLEGKVVVSGKLGGLPWLSIRPYEKMVVMTIITSDNALVVRVDRPRRFYMSPDGE